LCYSQLTKRQFFMTNKNIFKISAALLLATTSLVGYTAKAEESIRETAGVTFGPRIGLLGIGAEVAVPVNNSAAFRANLSWLPLLNADLTRDGVVKSSGTLESSNINGMILADWHPFANAFRLSIGAAYNKFHVTAKDIIVNFAGLNMAPVKDLIIKAAAVPKDAVPAVTEATNNIVKTVSEGIVPVAGPINLTAKLKSPFAPVLAFGADNSTDPDADFVYGFDVAFMLVDELDLTDNSTWLNFTAGGKEKIEEAIKAGAEKITNEANDPTKTSAEMKTLAKEFITKNSLGMFSLKTFGDNVPLASIFAGKMIVPSVMGHIAIPVQ
jgi:hypothetical protein